MTEHTLKFYGEELNQLKAEVARMGGLAEAQVADAVRAVADRDVFLAQALIGRDERLDEMQREIEQKAIRMIALRQPVAQDLRRTVAAMKMSWSLERTGDLAKNIAKRAIVISRSRADHPAHPLDRAHGQAGVGAAARGAGRLYRPAISDRAMHVWNDDQEVDENYNSLFRELLTYMMSDPRMISACAHLLFVAKNLERIGDHATNVAEMIHYEVTGEEIDRRPAEAGRLRRRRDTDVEGARMTPLGSGGRGRGRARHPAAVQPREGGLSASSVATDGEEALVLIDERQPDLVVLDWMLPKVSGIEVCRRLRQRPRPATCRSSCSPPAARRATGCAGWTPAPTTTWSSRSR